MYPDHINSTSQMASSNYRKYYTIMQLSIYHYLDKLVMNYLFISESTLQQRQVLSNNSIFFFSFLPGVLFGTTMLMVSISLVMAVIVTNLYLRKDSGKRVPYCVRKIFLGKVKRRTSLSAKINTTENHVLETKMHEIEIDNLSNHSEVETLTNRSRCNSRARRSTSYKGPEQIDTFTKISLEWQILAKIVDRLCFWIFLLSSIAALTSMFAQIPAYNAT